MHLDLFYELSVPPFAERGERAVYHETLAELAMAESLGFETAWLVEHHFMPEYSHSSAPDLFLAAASQRTQQLRLGHAIVPLPYHHPVHVAERLATLDVLSDGRVEFGFGRGFSPREYTAFGVDMADSRRYTEESLAVLRQSFSGRPVSFSGQHFQLEDAAILPQVVQTPHPPLWMATVSPESFDLAARLGVGALVGPFKPWFMVREDLRRYRRSWEAEHGSGPPAYGQNPQVAMTLGIHCAPDARTARAHARQGVEWFYERLLGQTRPVLKRLYEGYEYYRRLGRFRPLLERAANLRLLDTLGMAVVGDPAHCRERLGRLQEAGVDRLLLAFGAGAMPPAQVADGMRCFAEEVMPYLRA